MGRNKLSLFIISILIISFVGCKKQPEKTINKEFNKEYKIGILSHVGNIFEYYYKGNPFLIDDGNFKFIALNDWKIDNFIENEYKQQLKKRGYENIEIIYPSEKLILLKNEGKNIFDKEHNSELINIMKNNHLNVLFYVENFVSSDAKKIKIEGIKGLFVTKNLSLFIDNSLISPKGQEVGLFLFNTKIIEQTYSDNKVNSEYWIRPRVYSKKLEDIQYISLNQTYNKKKLYKLEPFFKELIHQGIDEYFEVQKIK